jgi:hypothetical protein
MPPHEKSLVAGWQLTGSHHEVGWHLFEDFRISQASQRRHLIEAIRAVSQV